MLRYAIALSLCLGILAGCSQSTPVVSKAPAPGPSTPIKVGDFQLNNPIDAGNVTLIPISYNKPISKQQEGNFITLGEAKKEGVVEIMEREGGEVSSLTVTNKGTRPILLLGGELLLGGKQDRIVARDVIVPPGKTVNVEVFCVEHDRWDGETQHFEYKDSVVPEKVRQAAAYDGQEAVWGEVGKVNEQAVFARGGTIAAGLSSETVTKAINSNLPKVLEGLKSQKDVVGVIYVLNGRIQSADLFGNPRIFEAAKESLVRGYLADGAPDASKPTFKIEMGTCRKFLEEILQDRDKRSKAQANGAAAEMSGRNVRGLELHMPSMTREDMAGSGYLHGNYAPKKH
jgi:hypothetical protein